MNPGAQYLKAILFCGIVISVAWVILAVVNGWDILLSGMFILGSVITFAVFFLPYFLFYVNKLSASRFLAFLPFLIIFLLLAYHLYNIASDRWSEVALGKRTIFRIWHIRVVEVLIVLIFCFWTSKKLKTAGHNTN
jgi:hypothetical protein